MQKFVLVRGKSFERADCCLKKRLEELFGKEFENILSLENELCKDSGNIQADILLANVYMPAIGSITQERAIIYRDLYSAYEIARVKII